VATAREVDALAHSIELTRRADEANDPAAWSEARGRLDRDLESAARAIEKARACATDASTDARSRLARSEQALAEAKERAATLMNAPRGWKASAREADILATLREPISGPVQAGNDAKERALHAVLADLDAIECAELAKRLQRAQAGDPFVAEVARMIPPRRARLLKFLGDARRRGAQPTISPKPTATESTWIKSLPTKLHTDREAATDEATLSAPDVATSGVAGEDERLPHHDRIQASFGAHDISGIRAHVGGPAAEASSQLGARAFAFGDHVAFANTPDLHTAAHEAAHVVQQRRGFVGDGEAHADAVADLVTRGEPAHQLLDHASGPASGIARIQLKDVSAPTPTLDANKYVRDQRRPLVNAIAGRILEVGVPQPDPRVRWTSLDEGAQAVANQVRAYIEAAPDVALSRMAHLCSPFDIEHEIAKRIAGPGGFAAVSLAVAAAFDGPIAESVRRVGDRLRARMDAHHAMPDPTQVVASSPLDRVVADAMRGHVQGDALAKGNKTEQRGRSLTEGAREVEYTWLGARDEKLWNWILVSSPKNPTAEDVATTPLAGGNSTGTEQAHRIAASPPYFGIPFETARLVPDAIKYAPAAIKAGRGTDPKLADAATLAHTGASDGAALAQEATATQADLAPDHALDRLELELATLQSTLAPWRAAEPLGAAVAFVARRRAEPPAEGTHWKAVLSAQERLVGAASREVLALTAEVPKGAASPKHPLAAVVRAYARAVEVSHLAAQAIPALAEARKLAALVPLAALDRDVDQARDATADADPGAALDLAKRAADLRARVDHGEKVDRDAVDALAIEAEETAVLGHLDSIERPLHELISLSGDDQIANAKYEGGLPKLGTAASVILGRITNWRAELAQAKTWRGPTPGNTSDRTLLDQRRTAVRRVGEALAQTDREVQIQSYVEWAKKAIEDKLLWQRIAMLIGRVAAEIALMIATMQIAQAGVTAVRGIMAGTEIIEDARQASFAVKLATSITAAGLNTTGNAALGGEVSWKAFVENAVAMGTMTTIMAPFEGLLGESAGIESELRTLGQRAVRTGTELALEASAGLAGSVVGQAAANNYVVASPASGEVVEQAFTLLVGKFVHQRASAAKARVDHAEKTLGAKAIAGIRAKWEQLAARSAKVHPTKTEALGFLSERYQFLREERALYKGHPELERGAEAEPPLGPEFVDVPLVLSHLESVVPGHSYLGTHAQIDAGLAALEATGLHATALPEQTPGTRRYQVDANIIEFHERATSRESSSASGLDGGAIAAQVPGVTYESGGTFRISSTNGEIEASIRRTKHAARIVRDGDRVAIEIPRGLKGADLERAVVEKLGSVRTLLENGRARIDSEKGIAKGRRTFDDFSEGGVSADEKAQAHAAGASDNASSLKEHASRVATGTARNEREMLAAIAQGDVPRYVARVDAEATYLKYKSFGRPDRQFIYATEPADLRGLSPAAALEKVGWTKEWMQKLVNQEIAVCIFDTQSAVKSDAGESRTSVGVMAWEHLINKALGDTKFVEQAISEAGVVDKAELAKIHGVLERTPVRADPQTTDPNLESKARAVMKMLNDHYSANDLFTGIGATMNTSGTLGVREVMVENNNTRFQLTPENHVLVKLGTLQQVDVDALR